MTDSFTILIGEVERGYLTWMKVHISAASSPIPKGDEGKCPIGRRNKFGVRVDGRNHSLEHLVRVTTSKNAARACSWHPKHPLALELIEPFLYIARKMFGMS